jgi:subtilase family serine protease
MHYRRIATALGAVSTLAAGVLAAAPGASAAPSSHAVPHTKPAWIAHAQHLGHASKKASVDARVYLAPKGGLAALQAAATAVSTPGSASYHRFLTTSQYAAQYGTDDATVQRVESWLSASGMKVTGVGAQNRYISVHGSVATANKAFGTSIEQYRHDGRTVQAPATNLTVPASLAGTVLTITGVDTTPHLVTPASKNAPPPAGFRNARPCSLYFGQIQAKYQADYSTPLPKFNGKTLPYAPCGYTGPQFRAAYEGSTQLDGSGVTVAITDAYAAPTIASDANTYAENHGDGSYAAGQLSQVVPSKFTHAKDCGPSGWYGEETLDVEAVHAMAPGATIRYYAAASCYDTDFLDTLALVVDENKASLVSNSWGDVEANESADSVAAYEQVFLQGAIQGISFMFSSGDNGDELANTGLKQADYPTSDPYVTSVGGTSAAIGASGAMSYETGWGTVKYSLNAAGTGWTPVGYLYGAGGGASALFNKPAYQGSAVPGPYRQVPDVGMDADPNTGMLIGETQTFPDGAYYGEYRIGGTSLASPLFTGITALSIQHAGTRVGLLNPTIYANSAAFTDVKGTPPNAGDVRVDYVNGLDATDGLTYSVRTFNQDSSLRTTKGYDLVTGVGAPNPDWLTVFGAPV